MKRSPYFNEVLPYIHAIHTVDCNSYVIEATERVENSRDGEYLAIIGATKVTLIAKAAIVAVDALIPPEGYSQGDA